MRFALVGFGRWGQRYATTIPVVDGARLTRIVTRDPARRHLAEGHAEVTSDWKDAVARADVDAVIIATPPSTHAEILRACVAAGKPAIVEKPLCLNAGDARALASECDASGVPVLVDHTLLFNPAYEYVKQRATSFGSVRFVLSEGMAFGPFRSDTPTLWDWAPHDVACCLDIIGGSPVTVNALGVDAGGALRSELDMIAMQLSFGDGARAWIHAGRLALNRRRSVTVFCDRGALVFTDGPSSTVHWHDAAWDERLARPSTAVVPPAIEVFTTDQRPLTRMVQYFVDAVMGRGDRSRLGLGFAADVVDVLARADRALGAGEKVAAPVLTS